MYLVSLPAEQLSKLLSPLYVLLDQRLVTMNKFARLQGRLELIMHQLESPMSSASIDPVIINEDDLQDRQLHRDMQKDFDEDSGDEDLGLDDEDDE